MAKFKRDIDDSTFMERYIEHSTLEHEERNKLIKSNSTDLAERDYY